MLSIAAAAVLLIATLAGLSSLRRDTSDSSVFPTINAPSTANSIQMIGGSPARDLNYTGGVPNGANPQEDWQFPSATHVWRSPVFFGDDLVYVQEHPVDKLTTSQVVAYDRITGAERWRAEVASTVDFILTDAGVVTTRVYSSGGGDGILQPPFSVTLLDKETGEPIWISTRVFQNWSLDSAHRMLVDDNAVYMPDRMGNVIKFDLQTGSENWVFASTDPSNTNVRLNTALGSGLLYVFNPRSRLIVAVRIDDGIEQWRQLAQGSLIPADVFTLPVAIPHGVVLVTTAEEPPTTPEIVSISELGSSGGSQDAPVMVLQVFDSADGAERWQLSGEFDSTISTDGSNLYVNFIIGDDSKVRSYDLNNGEQKWESDFPAYLRGYSSRDNALILASGRDGLRTIGFRPETGETLWEIPESLNCILSLPIADDGSFVCLGVENTARMYGSAARADVSTPDENPSADAIDSSIDPTGSGQITGPTLTSGQYSATWVQDWSRQSSDQFATSFGTVLYSTTAADAHGDVQLTAQDLSSGEALWQQPIPKNVPYVVTSQGIVTLVRDPADSSVLRVALFNLDGSRRSLASDVSVLPPQTSSGTFLIVSGTTILFSDVSGQIAAIDMGTGTLLWKNTVDRVLGPGMNDYATCEICVPRAGFAPYLSTDGRTVFMVDVLSGMATALDFSTGDMRWQRSSLDLVPPDDFFNAWISATPEGPLVGIMTVSGAKGDGGMILGLWSSDDGSTVWQKVDFSIVSGLAVTDHGTFYASLSESRISGTPATSPDSEICCFLAEYSLADGSLIWTPGDELPRTVIGILTSSNVLITNSAGPMAASSIDGVDGVDGASGTTILGIDATTHEQVFMFVTDGKQCLEVEFPIDASGKVVCTNADGRLAVFAPVDP